MKVGQSVRYSRIEQIIAEMNESAKKDELAYQQEQHFSGLSDAEIKEQLDGSTPEEYFEDELNALHGFELQEFGDECSIGSSFVTVNDPNGDAVASFVMTGYGSEGVFSCCYICELPPEPFQKGNIEV